MGVARLLPPLLGLDSCWPLKGVQEDPKEEAPDVEDNGEEDPSWMGGDAEFVDKRDVVDKSEKIR